MTNVIKFPRKTLLSKAEPAVSHKTVLPIARHSLIGTLISVSWVVLVLVWPLLKWMVSIDVLIQLIRMLYHWNNPDSTAGWDFLVHFAILVVLTYFVSVFKPKGI